jgi:hypothetical protein
MKEYRIQFDDPSPPRKKIAILGFSESTMDLAPYHDPSWAIWGENQLYRFLPRATRWYEMHADPLADQVAGTDYAAWMRACPIPLVMLERHPAYPSSVRYPIDERVAQFGEYFASSIAYMIADAIAEGAEEIGVWGVDMIHESEYGYQKPSCEALLYYAKGAGIKVTIPEQSALLKPYGLSGWRYGYHPMPFDQWATVIADRKAGIAAKIAAASEELARWKGAADEQAYWASVHEREQRGGALAGLRPVST